MSYPSIPIDSIVSGYKAAFDWLHGATSRNITIFVDPAKTGCPNNLGIDPISKKANPIYNSGNPFSQTVPTVIPSFGISGIINVPFSGGNQCPVCNGEGFIYAPASGTVSARIQWRNEDTKFDIETEKLKSTDFKVRIKVTGSYATDLLDRSIRVMIDGKACRIVKEGVPVGLRDIHSYYYYFNEIQ